MTDLMAGEQLGWDLNPKLPAVRSSATCWWTRAWLQNIPWRICVHIPSLDVWALLCLWGFPRPLGSTQSASLHSPRLSVWCIWHGSLCCFIPWLSWSGLEILANLGSSLAFLFWCELLWAKGWLSWISFPTHLRAPHTDGTFGGQWKGHWLWIRALPLTGWVTFSKSLNYSEP